MPGCNAEREVIGGIASYRIEGKFDGASAWDLCRRVEHDSLAEVALDFSRVAEFVDYGVAVLANSLLSLPHKRIRLQGLRQHQMRLFKYFGVDPEELLQREEAAAPAEPPPPDVTNEVA